ncbi:MAG: fibronectin type III domain-containing protein, partial [Cyclobacteriaceae bacterium]
VIGAKNYFYQIKAYNTNGNSFSGTESIITPNGAPVIDPITTVIANASQTTAVLISATDAEGHDISFSDIGLPDFITLVDNNDGTAELTVTPQVEEIGFYGNLAISASDILNASSTAKFKLYVLPENIEERIFLNFSTPEISEPFPFNNLANISSANTYTDLKNDANEISTIGLEILSGWNGTGATGMNTHDNLGSVPDNVMRTSWSTSSSAGLKFYNLEAGKYYNFQIFNSEFATSDYTTQFTSNGITKSLDGFKNTDKFVKLTGLQADTNGEITITVNKPSTSTLALLSSILIEKYDNTVILPPSNLTAEVTAENDILLQWLDNSGNETGFEIYRYNESTGINELLTTTNSNVEQYLDQGLTINTFYTYKIRAINGNANSALSNAASATTFKYQVYINVNEDDINLPGLPWNNLTKVPEAGAEWLNFIDENQQTTSIDMTLDTWETAATNVNGDSEGIYPDEVMRSYYYFNAYDDPVQFSLRDLDVNNRYNLVFFGSRKFMPDPDNVQDGTTRYIYGSDTVFLDAYGNKNQTISLKNIAPESDGTITFYIAANDNGTSNYGFLNAMVIQVFDDNSDQPSFAYKYYAKNGTDISDPNNWAANPDETGDSPASLSMEGITYSIPGNSNVNINSSIAIKGSGSKIVVGNNANLNVANDIGTIDLTSLELEADGIAELQTNGHTVDLIIGDDGLILHDNSVLKLGSNRLTINGKGFINSNNESGALSIDEGDITINSNFNFDSYLNFIALEDTVNNFTVNYANAKVILNNSLKVKEVVDLQAGTLTSNGNLVLASTPTKTGRIAALGNNTTIEGDIEIQRDISNKTYGFYMLGTAIKDKTLADLSDDIWIQGVDGHQFPTAWPNVRTYDESTSTWQPYTAHSDPLPPGIGLNSFLFSSNFADQVVNINYLGEPVIGDGVDNTYNGSERFSFPVTYSGPDHGWCLLANPYPSQIFWDSPDWVKTNVDGTVYVYDSENRGYVTFNNVGTGGFNGNIASGQGFFVRTNDPSPELTISEAVKTGDQSSFYRQREITDVLSISLINADNKRDEALIRIMDEASFAFEPDVDALKLKGSILNISVVDSSANDLVINSIPDFKKSIEIPLNIDSRAGQFRLVFAEQKKITKIRSIILEDRYLNKKFKLNVDSVYHFSITDDPASKGSQRFVLVLKSSYKPLVKGYVKNKKGNPIPEVKLVAQSTSQELEVLTDDLGSFDFRINPEEDYQIMPVNTNYDQKLSAGINIRDLALATQHLDHQVLESGLSQIALDIDNSGSINNEDLELLKSIVLGKEVEADQWKFIDQMSYNQQNPLSFNPYVSLNLNDD